MKKNKKKKTKKIKEKSVAKKLATQNIQKNKLNIYKQKSMQE